MRFGNISVPRRIVLFMGLLSIIVFSIFAFVTSAVIDLNVGGALWFFYFLLALMIIFAALTYFVRWKGHPYSKALVLVIFVIEIALVIWIGIEYQPFNAENLQLRRGVEQWFDGVQKPDSYYENITSLDTVDNSKMVKIMDQGSCAICWAAAGALSANIRMQTNGYALDKPFTLTYCNKGIDWLVSVQAIIDANGQGCGNGKVVDTTPKLLRQMAKIPTAGCVPFSSLICRGSNCTKPANYPVTQANSCVADRSYQYTDCTNGPENAQFFPSDTVVGYYSVSGEARMEKELSKFGSLVCVLTFYNKTGEKYNNWTLASTSLDSPFARAGNYTSKNFISRPVYDGNNYNKDNFKKGCHALAIVGYGIQDNVKYWIVANSWGTDWGSEGFSRIEKGIDAWSIETDCLAIDIRQQ